MGKMQYDAVTDSLTASLSSTVVPVSVLRTLLDSFLSSKKVAVVLGWFLHSRTFTGEKDWFW